MPRRKQKAKQIVTLKEKIVSNPSNFFLKRRRNT